MGSVLLGIEDSPEFFFGIDVEGRGGDPVPIEGSVDGV